MTLISEPENRLRRSLRQVLLTMHPILLLNTEFLRNRVAFVLALSCCEDSFCTCWAIYCSLKQVQGCLQCPTFSCVTNFDRSCEDLLSIGSLQSPRDIICKGSTYSAAQPFSQDSANPFHLRGLCWANHRTDFSDDLVSRALSCLQSRDDPPCSILGILCCL